MNNIKTISEKLITQADDELKAAIAKSFEAAESHFRTGSVNEIEFEQGSGERRTEMKINVWTLIDALKTLAFELQFERSRQDKIDNFMQRVESLQSEIESLTANL